MKRGYLIGDKVRVIKVPPVLPPDDELNTRSLFEACVGQVFPIVGINGAGWLELGVVEVLGKDSYMASIWIEPEFVEIVGTAK